MRQCIFWTKTYVIQGLTIFVPSTRKFLERRREEEDNITQMEEEEREVYCNQLTAEERSKNIKLTEKHCRQMMDLIYKKKMDYFKSDSGGDDWKEVLERSYPRDPPNVEPPPYNKGNFTIVFYSIVRTFTIFWLIFLNKLLKKGVKN